MPDIIVIKYAYLIQYFSLYSHWVVYSFRVHQRAFGGDKHLKMCIYQWPYRSLHLLSHSCLYVWQTLNTKPLFYLNSKGFEKSSVRCGYTGRRWVAAGTHRHQQEPQEEASRSQRSCWTLGALRHSWLMMSWKLSCWCETWNKQVDPVSLYPLCYIHANKADWMLHFYLHLFGMCHVVSYYSCLLPPGWEESVCMHVHAGVVKSFN